MKTPRMILNQSRYEWRAFWRNPAAAFFGAVFPLILLVIFNLLFGNNEIAVEGGLTRASTFYVPAIAALAVVNSCFTGLAMGASIARDNGVLKRVRGTPLPAWAYLIARIIVTTMVAVLIVAIVIVVGVLFFGVTLRLQALPAFIVTVVLGAACFSSLGLAVTAIIPNADAATAIVNGIALPLLFISDVFVRGEHTPTWVQRVADFFPIRHLSLALQTTFNPFATGSGFDAANVRSLAIWLLVGILLARRFFSWEPRR
jgi:ABC-2 type transport system permease protein